MINLTGVLFCILDNKALVNFVYAIIVTLAFWLDANNIIFVGIIIIGIFVVTAMSLFATIERSTGRLILYFPWNKKNRIKYTVNVTQAANTPRVTVSMSGLSKSMIPTELDIAISIDRHSSEIRLQPPIVLQPGEDLAVNTDSDAQNVGKVKMKI